MNVIDQIDRLFLPDVRVEISKNEIDMWVEPLTDDGDLFIKMIKGVYMKKELFHVNDYDKMLSIGLCIESIVDN